MPVGQVAWNKGLKGVQRAWNKGTKGAQVAWNKGRPWTEESKAKMRLAKLGKPGNRKGKTKFSDGVNTRGYHPFWHDIRKIVYKRDGWICQECGVHCKNGGHKHQICCHHIDYDTMHNDYANLITLCASCHTKTNWQREHWIAHYNRKMKGN